MKRFFVLTALLALLAASARRATPEESAGKLPADQVQVAGGRLAGTLAPNGVRSFKGVPFAAPPVGELRWQPPQAPQPWNNVRPARRFGPRAMQQPSSVI